MGSKRMIATLSEEDTLWLKNYSKAYNVSVAEAGHSARGWQAKKRKGGEDLCQAGSKYPGGLEKRRWLEISGKYTLRVARTMIERLIDSVILRSARPPIFPLQPENRSFHVPRYCLQKGSGINRFGNISIAARGYGLIFVTLHRKRGQGHHRDLL